MSSNVRVQYSGEMNPYKSMVLMQFHILTANEDLFNAAYVYIHGTIAKSTSNVNWNQWKLHIFHY